MNATRHLLSVTLLAAVVAAGCAAPVTTSAGKSGSKSSTPSGTSPDTGISVSDGGTTVDKDVTIELKPEGKLDRQVQAEAAAETFPYEIKYVSQVPPVMVGTDKVQANDLLVCGCGSTMAIAYNYAGDRCIGAVQLIDASDKSKPRVTREIKFSSMDINALYQDGNTLYFGGQADPDSWPFKAFIGKIDVTNPNGTDIANSLKGLKSHATTSITKFGDRIYVGVGARDGGVEVLDANLNRVEFKSYPDARSVVSNSSMVVGLAGTIDNSATTGRFLKLAPGADSAFALDDFKSAYAKATVDLPDGKLAYLGMSKAGFQVVNVDTRAKVYGLANPSTSELDAANGASTDGDLAFVANGNYGFRVVQILDRTKTNDAFAKLAGYHRMEGPAYDNQSYSANILRYKSGYLMVASGLGGVNIYTLKKR